MISVYKELNKNKNCTQYTLSSEYESFIIIDELNTVPVSRLKQIDLKFARAFIY